MMTGATKNFDDGHQKENNSNAQDRHDNRQCEKRSNIHSFCHISSICNAWPTLAIFNPSGNYLRFKRGRQRFKLNPTASNLLKSMKALHSKSWAMQTTIREPSIRVGFPQKNPSRTCAPIATNDPQRFLSLSSSSLNTASNRLCQSMHSAQSNLVQFTFSVCACGRLHTFPNTCSRN